MKICIVAAALPPQIDGIGDYSARLAGTLGAEHDVVVLTTSDAPVESIATVEVRQVFSVAKPASVRRLQQETLGARFDWVLLQYNPFSYGRRGWNPYLAHALRAIREKAPGTRIAVMVHEPFMPASGIKAGIMSFYQRLQLRALAATADLLLFSIQPWADRFQSWFPSKPCFHLPVSSNINRVHANGPEVRRSLGLGDRAIVVGLFGSAASGRLDEFAAESIKHLAGHGIEPVLLTIGTPSSRLMALTEDLPVRHLGVQTTGNVSRLFSAFDVAVSPFVDGVSTRRTSFMTALQHEIPAVATLGPLTDDILVRRVGDAFLATDRAYPGAFAGEVLRLAVDADLRRRIGAAGQRLYADKFDTNVVAARLIRFLGSIGRTSSGQPSVCAASNLSD